MGCGGSTAAKVKPLDSTSIVPGKETKGGISKAQFVIDNTGKVEDFYDVDKKKLGEGSYGSVRKCKHKASGKVRAVKTIPRAAVKNVERIQREVAIMKMMDHPNIIKLFESFADQKSFYLVMELCTGGELFDRIIDSGHFTEVQAAIVMQHILRAIHYMHEQKVCHRDLKPENFLFTTKDALEACNLKIIDFGLACQFKPGQVLTTKAGTPYYVAPQVLAGKYDKLSDLWSCGVIMYVLLCGYPPFNGDTDAAVLNKVRLGNFSFSASDWRNISEDAKNLIRNLLKMNPEERYSAETALGHVWVCKKAPRATEADLSTGFVDKLKSFRSQNKLKKAALNVIANQLTEYQVKALTDIFTSLDANQDGLLTVQELREGLEKAELDNIPEDLQQIMNEVDADGSGVIDYTEFLAATLEKQVYMQEDVCWQAFRAFDLNGDGKISKDEIAQVLGDDSIQATPGLGAKDHITELMQEVDNNGDGEIDFEEFMAMMRGGISSDASFKTNGNLRTKSEEKKATEVKKASDS